MEQEPPSPQQINPPAYIPPQNFGMQPIKQGQGKAYAVIAFIFAFIAPPVGLVMSIAAISKSTYRGLCITALIIASLGTLFWGAVAVETARILNRSAESQASMEATRSNQIRATAISHKATMYSVVSGNGHPLSIEDFSKTQESQLDELIPYISNRSITDKTDRIAIYGCGKDTGTKIEFWNSYTSSVDYRYTGSATDLSKCELLQP